MKNSQNIVQHVPSSPNLQSYNQVQSAENYSQEKRASHYEDKKLKYITEKLMSISEQLVHDKAISKLHNGQLKDSQHMTVDSSDNSYSAAYSRQSEKGSSSTNNNLSQAVGQANR
jgi:hypothetical protein